MKKYYYTATAILLWSTVATAFKISLSHLSFVQLLFFASWASLVSLFLILVYQRKLVILLKFKSSDWLKSAVMGILNPLLYYLRLFKAYHILPAQEAQALNWTWPITLMLFSAIFLGHRLTKFSIIAVTTGFAGVILIATRGDPLSLNFSNPLGVTLAISSSVVWATYWILNLKDKRDSVLKLFSSFCFGCIYITIIMFVQGEIIHTSWAGIVASIYVGLFEMGITFVIWLSALTLTDDSASVGILAYLTPFLSLIFIRFILGETILFTSVLGLALIIIGILVQLVNQTRAEAAADHP